MNGPGFDFEVLWTIGLAILRGLDPYSVVNSFYPPAASLIFAPLALLPLEVAYGFFLLLNAIVLVAMTKRDALGWLIFVPVLFMFAAGQTSLLLLPVMALLASKRRWASGLAVALFLLKPQMAFIVLPWYLIRWLIRDRERLVWSTGFVLIIHLAPLLYSPTIYADWIETIGYGAGHKFGGVGVWLLADHIGLWATALIGAVVAIAGLSLNEKTSRITMALANPVLAYYDLVILIDTAPWWVLGPASLIGLGLAHLVGGHTAFIIIPSAALAYRLLRHRLTIYHPRREEIGKIKTQEAK